MKRFAFALSMALLTGLTGLAGAAASDQETTAPPELTYVSGRLLYSQDEPTTGGVGYFIFQERLKEIPQENPMERVKAIAEAAVAVDADGSFTLNMAPGNYALIYDPAAEATDENLQPGAESQAVGKKPTPEQVKARIQTIIENVKQGMPIKDGKLAEVAYVIENRIVRPPVSEFGEMILGENHSVTVLAVTDKGKPVDFPLSLHLRGKSGDVYEPHPPSVSEAGTFTFYDVFPQSYQVFATAQKPRPGQGDEATTPTLKNATFVFEGTPMEHKVTVTPGKKAE